MIATQRIKSTNDKPVSVDGYEAINVLKWSGSKWKVFCPYYLKTDGKEINENPGGVLFENYYQGSKVYDKVYDIKVYASKWHHGQEKYLWFQYETTTSGGDTLIDEEMFDKPLYERWRNALWACNKAVRYPNGISRKKNVKFTLCERDGVETRMDYLTARRLIYFNEYVRLVRNLPEYQVLLDKIRSGKNLMLCEIDVPAVGRRGEHGRDCDGNFCEMNIEKIEKLMRDDSESFGHGLCLAHALLTDAKLQVV